MIQRTGQQTTPHPLGTNTSRQGPQPAHVGGADFAQVLRQQRLRREAQQAQQPAAPAPAATEGLVFSKHAARRLSQRRIDLGPEQSRRLEGAVETAAQRGARQSLVLVDGVAFIINVQERRVVTALEAQPGDATGQAVFTNIDSAVVA